jgi:hypothetical protein
VELTEEALDHRTEIALRTRYRVLDERQRKLSFAVFGLLAYSAFGNLVGALMALTTSGADAALALVLGALYSLGVYRVWFKDDTHWWPVAIPAGISLAVLALLWLGGAPRLIPLLLNVTLLILVPIRRRAVAAADMAAAALPNYSFKPTPLRGAA